MEATLSPKYQCLFTELHDVASQKAVNTIC